MGALLRARLARRAFTASFTDVGLRRSKSGSDGPSRKGVVKTRPVAKPIRITESSRRTYCGGVRAEDLDEKFPVVNIDSDALDAVRLLAEHRLNGLVVVTDTSETPYAVLPASQVVRFIVPGYVQDDRSEERR